MSKSLKLAAIGLAACMPAVADDVKAGAKVFRKCAACHAVGDKAKNKIGQHLNALFGRSAGAVETYKYSKAMASAGAEGLVWTDETVTLYLAKPKGFLKGTKMAFAGLKKDRDIVNVIAYLRTYSPDSEPAADDKPAKAAAVEEKPKAEVDKAALNVDKPLPEHGTYRLGRLALPEEIAAWDIDIRPNGTGLPPGRGTVAEGGVLFDEQCAVCHETLTDERPEKTVGSY